MNRSALLIALVIFFAVLAGVFAGAYFFGSRDAQPGRMDESETLAGMAAAEAAHARGDFEETFALLMPLAEEGGGLAQYRIGLMYDDGLGVEEDDAAAIEWLNRALQGGDGFPGRADAENRLGALYFANARGEDEVADQARWLARGAELGHAQSQGVLGSLYLQGVGVDRDPARAIELMTAAAEQDDLQAAANLGYVFQAGVPGVEADLEQSMRWYELAARLGDVRSQTIYASMLQAGVGGEADLTRAATLYARSAAEGDVLAQARLGSLVASGQALPPSPAIGAEYVALAVQDGDAEALGWLEAQAAEEDLYALGALAQLYFIGEGVTQDNELGLTYLARAAEAGHAPSQFDLGRRHGAGDGVEQDYVRAHKWSNLAAAAGLEDAAEARSAYTQLMTPEQLEAAQALAREWTEARRNAGGEE